jgi:hypothetical protein
MKFKKETPIAQTTETTDPTKGKARILTGTVIGATGLSAVLSVVAATQPNPHGENQRRSVPEAVPTRVVPPRQGHPLGEANKVQPKPEIHDRGNAANYDKKKVTVTVRPTTVATTTPTTVTVGPAPNIGPPSTYVESTTTTTTTPTTVVVGPPPNIGPPSTYISPTASSNEKAAKG